MKTLSFLLAFGFYTFCSTGQSTKLAAGNSLLKLVLTNNLHQPLQATVHFKNMATKEQYFFTTNKKGKADCIVAGNQKYEITIPGSNESYEYDIPDFVDGPLDLPLEFKLSENKRYADRFNAVIAIQTFNNPGLKELKLENNLVPAKINSIETDTTFIQVPINSNSIISIEGVVITGNRVAVDSSEFNILYHALYFTDSTHATLVRIHDGQSIMSVVYKDLYNYPLPNEKVTITSKKTGNVYSTITNSNGAGFVLVPNDDQFAVSLKYYPDFARINVGNTDHLVTNSLYIKFPGSLQIEQMKKEAALRLAVRDSLYKLYDKAKEENEIALQRSLQLLIPKMSEQMKMDPAYFQKEDNVVCAVLSRNADRWRTKMIVTDVTGSMYPYMRELALWHLLESMNKQPSQYVFFNDGDNLPDDKKIIGNTGGIYFDPNKIPDSLFRTMYKAMRNGSGGDGPENDIEALLKAQEWKSKPAELILIADNYSPVKDMALLENIKVPVRVILCGTSTSINLDCLEIAYKTGGSIHTIEEDILNLSILHDEDIITIGGKKYQFIKGKFFALKRNI